MFAHIVKHPLIMDLLFANLLGVLHPNPALCKAASRLSLKWLGQVG